MTKELKIEDLAKQLNEMSSKQKAMEKLLAEKDSEILNIKSKDRELLPPEEQGKHGKVWLYDNKLVQKVFMGKIFDEKGKLIELDTVIARNGNIEVEKQRIQLTFTDGETKIVPYKFWIESRDKVKVEITGNEGNKQKAYIERTGNVEGYIQDDDFFFLVKMPDGSNEKIHFSAFN